MLDLAVALVGQSREMMRRVLSPGQESLQVGLHFVEVGVDTLKGSAG